MTRPRLRSTLPEVFQSAAGSPPLQALLTVADAMLGPVADALDAIEVVADPYRAPDHVAAALAWWVDLGWLTAADAAAGAVHGTVPTRHTGRVDTQPRLRSILPGGTTSLRDLIAASAELAAHRGTALGMTRFLELATGATGWRLEVDPDDCHLRVHLPAGVESASATVATIVEAIKPAHITASVHAAPATQPPTRPPTGSWPLVPPTEAIPVAVPEPGRAPRNPFVDPASGSTAQPLDHTDPGSQP
jgi:cell division septation protein DedD